MDAREYEDAKAKIAAWNQRDQDYQRRLKELEAERVTVLSNRRNNKEQYGELLARVQRFEKDHGKTRAPHPTKPNVIVETVVETVAVEVPVEVHVIHEVEKPLSFGRALKKLFTGQ